ncbi:MAG: hypothetical protein ABI411_08610 [Tahibacter sp.]
MDSPSGSADPASYAERRYPVDSRGAIAFRVRDDEFKDFRSGNFAHRGGPRLRLGDGSVLDLRGFLIERIGRARVGLALADAKGTVWFLLDHAHVLLERDGRELALRHMDLRMAPELARRLHRPEWAGMLLGGAQTIGARVDLVAAISSNEPVVAAGSCSVEWPSADRRPDVRMQRMASNWEERQPDGINVYRCGRDDGSGSHTRICTHDSDDGLVVLSPDASLRNEGNASVAWHPKFSAPAPPYGNDQHPFLVWNMYRADADGSLHQIGVSAAKHAFHTINAVCGCPAGEILYPGCEDTYGGFSNDFPTALAPRAEIVSRSAQWGRCGSLYDRDCDGVRDAGDGLVADDAYSPLKHMAVSERDLSLQAHPGARWFVEYWYVVRDDADPWNTFGLMEVQPAKVPGQGADPDAWLWRFDVIDFRNRSMVDTWTDTPPETDVWNETRHLDTPQGRVALAVQVRRIDASQWRYDYTLFNMDFAISLSSGAEPNLRVISNHGLVGMSLPVADEVLLEQITFSAGGSLDTRRWIAQRAVESMTWAAQGAASLDWGSAFSFGFVANRPPRDGRANLTAIDGSVPHDVPTLLPGSDPVPARRRAETLGDVAPPRRP